MRAAPGFRQLFRAMRCEKGWCGENDAKATHLRAQPQCVHIAIQLDGVSRTEQLKSVGFCDETGTLTDLFRLPSSHHS